MGNYFINKIKSLFSKKALNLDQVVLDVKNDSEAKQDDPTIIETENIINTQNQNTHLNNNNTMFNYGIGGQSVPQEASEAMADIAPNRSLFVQKLTEDDAIKPEVVYDLKTVEEVFEHFKPKVSVDFETADNNTKSETLHFGNVGDFGAKTIVEKSPFLQELAIKQEQYQKIIKQLKSNKLMGKVLEKPETKAAFVNALQLLINELDENK